MVKFLGKFGWGEERYHTVTVGLNKKGGMDDALFETYIIQLVQSFSGCCRITRQENSGKN